MNKKRLAKIYKEISRDNIDLSQAVKEIGIFLETLEEALLENGKVKFVEKGTFEILKRKPRTIANPLTKELMTIYPKKSVKFTASKKLRKVNQNENI